MCSVKEIIFLKNSFGFVYFLINAGMTPSKRMSYDFSRFGERGVFMRKTSVINSLRLQENNNVSFSSLFIFVWMCGPVCAVN